MSTAVTSSPANQNRPLLLSSPLPSDRRVAASAGRMRTLLDLLSVEKMDGLDHRPIFRSDGGEGGGQVTSKWRILKERLGLNVIGCCGVATWRFGSPPRFPQDDVVLDINPRQQSGSNQINLNSNRENIEEENNERTTRQQQSESELSHTNLAEALAAEREYRETGEETPSRVSLMRLLEETAEGGDLERERKREDGEGSDQVCCVCMGRKKGAALIPCGHTYCRVCSREVWLHRRSCPLCNQPILEILHIF